MQIKSQEIHKRAIRVAWFIFFAAFAILLFSLNIVWQNQQSSKVNYHLLELMEEGQEQVIDLTHSLRANLAKESENSVEERNEILNSFEELGLIVDEILEVENVRSSSKDEGSKNELARELEKTHDQLDGIISLIVKHDKGVKDNKELISARLLSVNSSYLGTLQSMENLLYNENNSSSTFLYHSSLVVFFLFMLLAVVGLLFIITPMRKVFADVEMEALSIQEESNKALNKALAAETSKKEIELVLKTKVAQTIKLQESLKIAIDQSIQTKRDKNMVYHNAATDIDEYLKVITKQREILENHTSISGEQNWKILINTVSQLNSLVGDYFNRAKLGEKSHAFKDVYLSPLMSEIMLSLPKNTKISFEQADDMPTVTTNAELLKRVLSPFFELISMLDSSGKVRVMVSESGSVCEIKFMETPASLQNALEELEVKELSRLSFNEFKIHMAQKIIEERGGNSWFQLDATYTGVFYINWVL